MSGGLADIAAAKYQDIRMSVTFDRCMADKDFMGNTVRHKGVGG